MVQRFCGVGVVMAAALVVWQGAVTQADDHSSVNRVTASIPAQPGGQSVPLPDAHSYPAQATLSEATGRPPASSSPSIPSQSYCPVGPTIAGTAVTPGVVALGYEAPDASWYEPVQLPTVELPMPQTQPLSLAAPPVVALTDVTCQDDGHYVILNINGQKIRFAKSQVEPDPSAAPDPKLSDEGTVRGRLLHKGQPVVNCCVAIVCMHKENVTDSSDDSRLLMSTTTDDQGVYCFEHVPAGEYKLTWLPSGTKQWIRRIGIRPDVFMHAGQDVSLKDVRMALQTIN